MSNAQVAGSDSQGMRAWRGALVALGLAAGLSACAAHWPALHWPWTHRAAPAPQPVSVLSVEGAGAIVQYWDRNTLQVDLTAESGDGSAVLRAPHGWPIRLEFKVRPGSFGRLEVVGRDRVVFDVPAQGGPTVLPLAPAAYAPDTPQIAIRWSEAAGSER